MYVDKNIKNYEFLTEYEKIHDECGRPLIKQSDNMFVRWYKKQLFKPWGFLLPR